MLRDYRNFLASELELLGNASHHAYAFGQANMAKRALDAFDAELAHTVFVPIARVEGYKIMTALSMLQQQSTSPAPELATLQAALAAAFTEAEPPIGEERSKG